MDKHSPKRVLSAPSSLQEYCVYRQRWLALPKRNESPVCPHCLPLRNLSDIPQTTTLLESLGCSKNLQQPFRSKAENDVRGCSGKYFCESFWFRLLSRSMLGCGEDERFWNITILTYGIMSGGGCDFKQWFMMLERGLAAPIMAMCETKRMTQRRIFGYS